MDWSKDGSELLLMMRSFVLGDDKINKISEHYSFNILAKRYARIDGGYDSVLLHDKFFRDGKLIPMYEQGTIRLDVPPASELVSPDAHWSASLDRDSHVLTVKAKDGAIVQVGKGSYNHCSGVTIGNKAVLYPDKHHPARIYW